MKKVKWILQYVKTITTPNLLVFPNATFSTLDRFQNRLKKESATRTYTHAQTCARTCLYDLLPIFIETNKGRAFLFICKLWKKCQTVSLHITCTCLMIEMSKISHPALPSRTPHTFFLSVTLAPLCSPGSFKVANGYQESMKRNWE